jgi:hypothetical protein
MAVVSMMQMSSHLMVEVMATKTMRETATMVATMPRTMEMILYSLLRSRMGKLQILLLMLRVAGQRAG